MYRVGYCTAVKISRLQLYASMWVTLRSIILAMKQTMDNNSIYIVLRNRENEIKYLGSGT